MEDHTKKTFKGKKTNGDEPRDVNDLIIAEEALQININGKPFTMTMRTPGDDQELIRGLLYTENLYTKENAPIIKVIDYHRPGVPASVNVPVPPGDIGPGYYESRSIMSVASCGICGKREWAEILSKGRKLECDQKIRVAQIPGMFASMKAHQITFDTTGGCHAAAIFDFSGSVLSVKEDIGRHNAVDKVIGDLLLRGELSKAGILLVSGRISFEIVSKTFKAGIPILAAVSSPSSLAIEVSDELGITLMAFCRQNSLTCYSHPERLIYSKSDVYT